jgi:hypothetical protein
MDCDHQLTSLCIHVSPHVCVEMYICQSIVILGFFKAVHTDMFDEDTGVVLCDNSEFAECCRVKREFADGE